MHYFIPQIIEYIKTRLTVNIFFVANLFCLVGVNFLKLCFCSLSSSFFSHDVVVFLITFLMFLLFLMHDFRVFFTIQTDMSIHRKFRHE